MTEEFALIPVDDVLLEWADEIVYMEIEMSAKLSVITTKPIICLHIEDSFSYRDPDLMKLIKERYPAHLNKKT